MSALLKTQEEGGSEAASAAIDEADTNGDGMVSLAELAASLRTDEASLSQAFTQVDADADGQINQDELETGLKSLAPPGPGRPHGPPPSAGDIAADVLASADNDESGALSLDEISTALGQDDQTSLSDAFAALDTDGDGGLGAEELTSAVTAAFARQMAAYSADTDGAATWSLSLAA